MPKPSKEAVENAFTLLKDRLSHNEEVVAAALFGFSPLQSTAEDPDLDIIVITKEHADQNQVNTTLQEIASQSALIIDAWILNSNDLLTRMQRIAAKHPQPSPTESLEGWNGPAFIVAFGREVLAQIIEQANAQPVHEAPIPPDSSSKKLFRP